MPLRHFLALLLLIVTPLILIGWFGTSALTRQQQQQQEQLQSAFNQRLHDLDDNLQQLALRYEATLKQDLIDADRNRQQLSAITREQPVARTAVLVDRDGRLIHPPKPSVNDNAAMAWHAALTELARTRPVGESAEGIESTRRSMTSKGIIQPKLPTRWQSWFHEDGLQLVLWLPREDRTATGIVLERGRWMSDLVDALPHQTATESGRYELRDSTDRSVYRWGDRNASFDLIEPLASLRLASPWNGWRLTYTHLSPGAPGWWADGTLPLLATLAAVAVAFIVLGTYVMTAMRREMSLARQRVSFASHVSHELRTPLTNIRLYAELAKRDLKASSGDERVQLTERLNVIEEESQRLSRLVTGVLDMVSGKGKLNVSTDVPDETIGRVLASFEPSLAGLNLTPELHLDASQPIHMDTDVVELVLVNLLSNIEKYAAEGIRFRISSTQTDSMVTIDVIDQGPGITKSDAKRIFEPFERLDDSLSAPAGTGLGLAIARGAAQRHGGDLIWISSTNGAHFRFTFQPVKS